MEAIEGEQALHYTAQRREHLRSLLQMDVPCLLPPQQPAPATLPTPNSPQQTLAASLPTGETPETASPVSAEDAPAKTIRRKRTMKTPAPPSCSIASPSTAELATPPKKRRTRKTVSEQPTPMAETAGGETETGGAQIALSTAEQRRTGRKGTRRVGERKPTRDPVG